MRILVTGGRGFIGRQALLALSAAGHEPIVVSTRQPERSIAVEWHVADLLKTGEPERIAKRARADRLLHLAWTTENGRFWTDPANLDWVATTLALVRAAVDAGASHICAAGTCYEYDWPASADCHEALTPVANHTLYDASKDGCRRVLERFAVLSGATLAWARLFYLYGPHEHPDRLVPHVARSLLSGNPARCTRGLSVRDYMNVRDAGRAVAALCVSNVSGCVNIASGEPRSVAELVATLGRLTGRSDLIRLGALPDRPDEPPRITADTTRLRHEVGFERQYSLEDGLNDALGFWKGRLETSSGAAPSR